MNTKQTFLEQYPKSFFAHPDDIDSLTHYLDSISFLNKEELITQTSIPGAGNMNVVIRVETNQRNFILKQSRPWVEKYPHIAAPINRIHIEADYYQSIQTSDFLQEHSPSMLYVDHKNFVLLMADLGDVEDFTKIYTAGQDLTKLEIEKLSNYLIELHRFKPDSFPANKEMRLLNHEHIFDLPFQSDNDLELDQIQPGLAKIAKLITEDSRLQSIVHQMGELYLSDGDTLLHGDYYPGSWMSSDQFYVLDPEFSFLGPSEFDLGVCLAHLSMADQDDELIQLFLNTYGRSLEYQEDQVKRFAGIEILRRLLGVAQLPLPHTVSQKIDFIEKSRAWIMS